jgi:hypothetical protein
MLEIMQKNPYNICTLDSNSSCKECKILGKLDCKLDKNQQKTSMKTVFSFILIAILGLIVTGILTGLWLLFILYIIFILLFFFIIEVKINCSHCPYYAENKKFLNCLGNNFFPKIWKFNPKPISHIEQIESILGFAILGIFPILSEMYGIWFIFSTDPNLNLFMILGPIILLIITIISYFVFISLFLFKFCSKCINFSCRFNKVPQELVNEYLKRNPVINDAWKNSKISKGKG